MNGLLATVDFWGVRKHVRLEVVDEPVQPGDYILNHVGYAIRRIPAGETTTFEFRADRAGTFRFYSNLTGEGGHADMQGQLVVRAR